MNDEVNKILNEISDSDKSENWKAIQFKKILDLIFAKIDSSKFYDAYKNFTEALKIKINNHKKEIEYLGKIIEDNRILTNEKEQIENKYKELEIVNDELNELRTKKDFLKENSLESIEKEITENTLINSEIKEKFNTILSNLNRFLDKERSLQNPQLKNNVIKTIKNLEILEKQQKGILIKLDTTTIDTKIDSFKKDVEALTKDYNNRVEKINGIKEDLEEINEKHSEVMEVFNLHHLENNSVFGELERREGVLKHVQIIRDEIKDKLYDYDTKIKEIVNNRDKLPIYELQEMKKYDL